MHMSLVNLSSAAVGVFQRPDAHDVVDPLSAAVEVDRPHGHDPVDPLPAALGVDRPHAHDLVNPLSAAVLLCTIQVGQTSARRQRQPWGQALGHTSALGQTSARRQRHP